MDNKIISFTNQYANSIKKCSEYYLKKNDGDVRGTQIDLFKQYRATSNEDTRSLIDECIKYLNQVRRNDNGK